MTLEQLKEHLYSTDEAGDEYDGDTVHSAIDAAIAERDRLRAELSAAVEALRVSQDANVPLIRHRTLLAKRAEDLQEKVDDLHAIVARCEALARHWDGPYPSHARALRATLAGEREGQ